ncbi:MAG: peptide-methionine (S)-S-oxide reductase MsrA [Ferruginibacter sp.]
MKLLLLTMSSLFGLFTGNAKTDLNKAVYIAENLNNTDAKMDTATFGTGCFWCTEAIFQQLEGVIKVTSGYSGGYVPSPTYKQVCTGTTGHAECLNIIYDPAKIGFDELLEVFWQIHDPTTLNRQGNDIGTQYRSVVFYHNQQQKELAEKYKAELNKSGAWDNPVITTLEPMKFFYPAEDYHQNYYNANTGQGYCQFVIKPKLEKFEKVFKSKLKKH